MKIIFWLYLCFTKGSEVHTEHINFLLNGPIISTSDYESYFIAEKAMYLDFCSS